MSLVKRIGYFLDGIVLALQFLTTIPIKKQIRWDTHRASMSLAAFPVIGIILGFILSLVVYLLLHYSSISSLIIVFLVIFLSIVYSGALHLDGWMDVSDAVLSHREQSKKLEIMKDPRVGAFAVISIIFLLGWRFIFMYETLQVSQLFWLYVFIIPFLSRWLMGFTLIFGKPARNEGLAYMYQPYISRGIKMIYVVWMILLTIIIAFYFPSFLVVWFILLSGLIGFFFLSLRFFNKQFGGVTGDTIGANGEGGETLLWMMLFLLHYFAMA